MDTPRKNRFPVALSLGISVYRLIGKKTGIHTVSDIIMLAKEA